MKNLGEIIKNYRDSHNLSMDDFADLSGISKTYIAMLEKNYNPSTGKEITPSLNIYNKSAKAMKMSLETLLKMLPNTEIMLSAIDTIDKDISNIIPLNKAKKIPILGSIACGTPTFAEQNYEGYFIADEIIKADFALQCIGESMIDAEIYDGDLAFLKKVSDVDSGKIAAVLIEDEATLKKVIKTDEVVILQPCNSDTEQYKPMIINSDKNVLILGELVGVYHYVK